MKRFLLAIGIITGLIGTAYGDDDSVTRAMKLYERRHYTEAAVLGAGAPAADPSRQGALRLTMGMVYLKTAELYRELYPETLQALQDYLKKLAVSRGQGRSRIADFYFAETQLDARQYGVAASRLERFAAEDGVDPLYRTLAKADLGFCYFVDSGRDKAEALWNTIDATNPLVRSELAFLYSRAGLKEKNPSRLAEQALADQKKTGKTPPIRMVRNLLAVYARSGETDKGLDLLSHVDLKAYSFQEVLGRSKVINFYDPSLLDELATIYAHAAVAALEKAAQDAAVKDPAQYYLALAYAQDGGIEQSSKIAAAFLAASRMPQQYKDRVRVWQAANLYAKGQKLNALAAWEELGRKQPPDFDLTAEVLSACTRVRADCLPLVKRAEGFVEAGEGKKLAGLNFALGKYYLARRNPAKALLYMEAGRDKSNKNKIESNDPVMLIDLAGMYYRSKKFSEALEIYFEMSKQFPAVRQIQEAMQGVYATEQKSAGDVKIF